MRTLSRYLILLAACATPVCGQTNTVLAQIPLRMQHFIDDKTVAGAVTLVSHGGDIAEFHALGMADIEAGHPMQKDTIFQIHVDDEARHGDRYHDAGRRGEARAARSRRTVPARVPGSTRCR